MAKQMESNICSVCDQPILPGQPVHGVRGIHWDCYEGRDDPDPMDELRAAIKKTDDVMRKLNNLKRRLRNAKGA